MLNIFSYQVMQIKTSVGYHHTPTGMAKIIKTDNTRCCQGCGETRTHLLIKVLSNITTLGKVRWFLITEHTPRNSTTRWNLWAIKIYFHKSVHGNFIQNCKN